MDTQWWSAWTPKLSAYAILLRLLIDARISAKEFQTLFLQMYQDDPTEWPIHLLDVLEELFADVDELGEHGWDNPRHEAELRHRARLVFNQFSELAPAVG